MNVNVCKVSDEYVDDSEDYFEDDEGNKYYYQIEICPEENGHGSISIEDTCGRFIPIDYESLEDIVDVLSRIVRSNAMKKSLLIKRDALNKEIDEHNMKITMMWGN